MPEQTKQVLEASRIRPSGLRLGGVLLLLFGIFELFSACSGIFILRASTLPITFYVLDGILALVEFFLAWSLWSLKPWAFWAIVSVEVVCIAIPLLVLVIWRSSSSLLTNLVFPVAILLCLFVDPNVRPIFRTRSETIE